VKKIGARSCRKRAGWLLPSRGTHCGAREDLAITAWLLAAIGGVVILFGLLSLRSRAGRRPDLGEVSPHWLSQQRSRPEDSEQ
jgi:hypothetical protein